MLRVLNVGGTTHNVEGPGLLDSWTPVLNSSLGSLMKPLLSSSGCCHHWNNEVLSGWR